MEQNDLKDILTGNECEPEKVSKVKTSEKQILQGVPQNDGIGESIDEYLPDEEEKSIYDREWTKLEKGMKLNRLQLFVGDEQTNRNLSDTECLQLKDLLFKMCNEGLFNKSNIVSYEKEKITNIKILEYDEEKRVYRGKRQKKKIRTTPKSKSNLDRVLKKK
jgi:hypothetical protein|tara:strand:- start:1560 stop:2045 length:486 start_codon:yes stop_codon:yes gene_type:complete